MRIIVSLFLLTLVVWGYRLSVDYLPPHLLVVSWKWVELYSKTTTGDEDGTPDDPERDKYRMGFHDPATDGGFDLEVGKEAYDRACVGDRWCYRVRPDGVTVFEPFKR